MRISDWSSDVCSSDLDNDIGELLGTRGREFGVNTGRKRRCGWFDAVLVRQSAAVSGITGIALTKLDILEDRKSVVKGKSVSIRVDLGGRRIIKKKKHK